MISKPLIEVGALDEIDREKFLEICRVTDNDPVTVAALTDTNICKQQTASGTVARAGRMPAARGVFRAYVKAAIQNYDVPPEAAKKFVQAARMQVLHDSLRTNDHKLALEATKQIGGDQSIFGPTQIEIKVDALEDILNTTNAEVISAVYLPDEVEEVESCDEKENV